MSEHMRSNRLEPNIRSVPHVERTSAVKTPNPTPKAKTCQVNRPRWAALVPDQKPCTKEVSKPSAALCARHEKLLPKGWRKLEAEHRGARVATATQPAP